MPKAEALELCLESLSSRLPVVALLEMHRFLAPSALPGYSVAAGAQNTSWWQDSMTGAATGSYSGGVVLAVDESRACFLAFETAQCFVAGVLHLSGLGDFVVAAVYIPPHESKYSPGVTSEW